MSTSTDRARARRRLSLSCLVLLAGWTLGQASGQELIYRLQGLSGDPNVQFGRMWRLVSVPDLDGDGVDDLVIATAQAWETNSPCFLNFAEGAYVIVSGATGGRISPVFYSCLPGSQGTSFDTIGDFNGDGRADLLLGRPRSFTGQGWVDVVDLATGTVNVTVESPFAANFDVIGNKVRSLGDLDGDGLPEFATVQDSQVPLEDGWLVFFSPDGSRVRQHHWLEIDTFGGAMLGIGDVDGDGFSDYIGSQPYVVYPTTRGVLNVFSGISGDLIHFISSPNGTQFSWFGASLENFYDLDQDGLDDILVMSRGQDSCSTWVAHPLFERARLDVISPASGEVVQTIRLAREGNPFLVGSCPGFVLDSGGDVNGDGIPDIAESRRTVSVGYIYSGATGVALFKHQGIVSSSGGARAESRIIPDVDGDGFDDWTLGAGRDDTGGLLAGSISVFRGAPGDAHTFCPGGINSSGMEAELYFDGPISISANFLHYVVENGPPGELALAVYGPNVASQPFGAGTLCVGGTAGLYRVGAPAAFDSAGRFVLAIDMTQGPMGSGPGAWMPGDRWITQVVYRDGITGNTTNAMDVTFTP